MRRNVSITGILSKIGVLCIVAAIIISISMKNTPSKLMGSIDSACAQIELFMEAFCRDDFAAMNQCLLNDDQIEATEIPLTGVSGVLRNAYLDTMMYEFTGDCFASEFALCQTVTVQVLDIPCVLRDLIENYQRTFGVEVTLTENNDFVVVLPDGSQKDFFSMVTVEFAEQLLEKHAYYHKINITFEQVYKNGQWKILLNEDVMNLLTGGINA